MKNKNIFDKPLKVSQPKTNKKIKEAFEQGRFAEIQDSECETSTQIKTKHELDSFFKTFFKPF